MNIIKTIFSFYIFLSLILGHAFAECFKGELSTVSKTAETNLSDLLRASEELLRSKSVKDERVKTVGGIHKDDKRVARNKKTPKYLNAVGRIVIDKKNGKNGICSGSLVGKRRSEDSRIVVTAYHCGTSLAKNNDVEWKTINNQGKLIKHNATTVYVDPFYDIAILLLDKPVKNSEVKPLVIETEYKEEPTDFIWEEEHEQVVAAGYSADAEIGKNGSTLSYHMYDDTDNYEDENAMEINYHTQGMVSSEVFSYEGASGGALIVKTVDITGETEEYIPYLIGTLKGGGAEEDLHQSSNGATGSNFTTFSSYLNYVEVANDFIEEYNL